MYGITSSSLSSAINVETLPSDGASILFLGIYIRPHNGMVCTTPKWRVSAARDRLLHCNPTDLDDIGGDRVSYVPRFYQAMTSFFSPVISRKKYAMVKEENPSLLQQPTRRICGMQLVRRR